MTKIVLDLTVEETNVVLNALGAQPFAQVFQLITKIQQQAAPQADQGATPSRTVADSPALGDHGQQSNGKAK